VKHEVKAQLTVGSSGASGGEGARTQVQVLANSAVASALILLHLFRSPIAANADCWIYGSDLIIVGIVRYIGSTSRTPYHADWYVLVIMPLWQQIPSPQSLVFCRKEDRVCSPPGAFEKYHQVLMAALALLVL